MLPTQMQPGCCGGPGFDGELDCYAFRRSPRPGYTLNSKLGLVSPATLRCARSSVMTWSASP